MKTGPRVLIHACIAASLVSCSGGDGFVPAPGPNRRGHIDINASTTVIDCPKITSYTISPYENAANTDVLVTSTADVSYGMRPVFRWTATSGSFLQPDHQETTYHCGAEINPVITLSVTYGNCMDEISIEELDCS